MSTLKERDEALARHLGGVIRHGTAEPPAHELVAARARLTVPARRAPGKRWKVPAFAAALLASVCALAAFGWIGWKGSAPTKEPAITWGVRGSDDVRDKWVTTADAPATLIFSDSTTAVLQPRGRLRVLSTDPHGAVLLLEEGDLQLEVRHLPEARWSVVAGPFVVRVTGTRLITRWRPRSNTVQVDVSRGSVEIASEQFEAKVAVTAGWTFRNTGDKGYDVRPSTTEVVTPDLEAGKADLLVQQPETKAGAARESAPVLDWQSALQSADYRAIVTDAEQAGLEANLRQRGLSDLRALAEAARYERKQDVAERALLVIRQRFPGRASKEAFMLGRLEEGRGRAPEALSWYARYLEEAPRGPLAADARGAQLVIAARSDLAQARVYADEYLHLHPDGIHARLAKRVVEGRLDARP